MLRIIQFCVHTNFIVAFAALSLYMVTELLFQFQNNDLKLFVFFSTLLAYNYMRIQLLDIKDKSNLRAVWLQTNKSLFYYVLIISACFTFYSIHVLGSSFLKLIFPVIIISLLYPLKFKIRNNVYAIRSIPFFKLFLISLTWSYVTFLVPLVYVNTAINYLVLDFFLQRLLFLLGISILFDIRDIDIDCIKTIPNTFGVYQSKLFAWFCFLLIDLLLIINLINNKITLPFFIALFLCIEIGSIAIYFSHSKNSIIFYGILVEGLSIIMCLFVIIASIF